VWEEVQEGEVQAVNGEVSQLDCVFKFNKRILKTQSSLLTSPF
jgi:hypothetical protein